MNVTALTDILLYVVTLSSTMPLSRDIAVAVACEPTSSMVDAVFE